MRISSKQEFFRLWEAGVLGNRLRIWRDPMQAFIEVERNQMVGFREIGQAGAGRFEMVAETWILYTASKWTREGRQFMICESAPDHLATVQGEVMRHYQAGWVGFLACPVLDGARMRDSLRTNAVHCAGVQVVDIFNRFMDQQSRDDIEQLFELYPRAVVEFTCYGIDVGILPNRNTIVWEVRNY